MFPGEGLWQVNFLFPSENQLMRKGWEGRLCPLYHFSSFMAHSLLNRADVECFSRNSVLAVTVARDAPEDSGRFRRCGKEPQ